MEGEGKRRLVTIVRLMPGLKRLCEGPASFHQSVLENRDSSSIKAFSLVRLVFTFSSSHSSSLRALLITLLQCVSRSFLSHLHLCLSLSLTSGLVQVFFFSFQSSPFFKEFELLR